MPNVKSAMMVMTVFFIFIDFILSISSIKTLCQPTVDFCKGFNPHLVDVYCLGCWKDDEFLETMFGCLIYSK
jgi:hypothetical protein